MWLPLAPSSSFFSSSSPSSPGVAGGGGGGVRGAAVRLQLRFVPLARCVSLHGPLSVDAGRSELHLAAALGLHSVLDACLGALAAAQRLSSALAAAAEAVEEGARAAEEAEAIAEEAVGARLWSVALHLVARRESALPLEQHSQPLH